MTDTAKLRSALEQIAMFAEVRAGDSQKVAAKVHQGAMATIAYTARQALSELDSEGEGYVLVPREPTQAMLEADKPTPQHWNLDGPDGPMYRAAIAVDRMAARSTWLTMLDAALTTTQGEGS